MPRLRSSSLIVSLAPAFWCFWSADAGSKANIGFPMIAARFTSIDLRLQVSTNSGSEFLSGSLGLLWLPAIDEDLPPPERKKKLKIKGHRSRLYRIFIKSQRPRRFTHLDCGCGDGDGGDGVAVLGVAELVRHCRLRRSSYCPRCSTASCEEAPVAYSQPVSPGSGRSVLEVWREIKTNK